MLNVEIGHTRHLTQTSVFQVDSRDSDRTWTYLNSKVEICLQKKKIRKGNLKGCKT